MDAAWTFSIDGSRVTWDWRDGPPPIDRLSPVRTPRSGARSRHVPATAYSTTTSGWLHLESGLEHDLVRALDRQPDVKWIVAQPVLLAFTPGAGKHLPDLLSLSSGGVTLWDCRSEQRQDADFTLDAAATASACARIGWRYEVFSGQAVAERLNERWLAGFRRHREWHERHRPSVVGHCTRAKALGDLLQLDDGSGELTSTVWHLLWTGEITCDLDRPLSLATSVTRTDRA